MHAVKYKAITEEKLIQTWGAGLASKSKTTQIIPPKLQLGNQNECVAEVKPRPQSNWESENCCSATVTGFEEIFFLIYQDPNVQSWRLIAVDPSRQVKTYLIN